MNLIITILAWISLVITIIVVIAVAAVWFDRYDLWRPARNELAGMALFFILLTLGLFLLGGLI